MVKAPEDGPAQIGSSYTRLIDQGMAKEHFRHVPPAGVSLQMVEDTTQMDLQCDIYYPLPETPRSIHKFRKNTNPGVICVHRGLQGQPLPHAEHRYGVKSNSGESAARTLEAGNVQGIQEYMLMRAETVYASSKREPLGRTYNRGHVLPDATKSKDFKGFGIDMSEDFDAIDAKYLLFPRGGKPDSEEVKEQYKKTHGNYEPGEQVTRKYKWPEGFDVKTNTFGKEEEKGDGENMQGCVNWANNQTKLVKRVAEDYRSVAHDPLGKSMNYMQGELPVKPGHSFGKPSKQQNSKRSAANESTMVCLRGNLSIEEQQPDKDLGKCLIVGRRNFTNTRAFGCPSIRSDIPAPSLRSVADAQNYGDEVGASALLGPQRFENLGVPDENFLVRRSYDEVKALCEATGDVDMARFDGIFEKAVSMFSDGEKMVSLDAILYVNQEQIKADVAIQHDTIKNIGYQAK